MSVLVVTVSSCESVIGVGDSAHVDELPRLGVAEEVRIGSFDDPVAGFSRIGGVEVADDGTIYVLESQAREVRVFGPDGTALRSVGGPGEGPGEFRFPADFGLLGDTLWVWDGQAMRLSWFGSDGGLLFDTPGTGVVVETGIPGTTVRLVPGRPLAGGRIASVAVRPGNQTAPYSFPVLHFDREGEVVDTVGRKEVEPSGRTVRVGTYDLNVPELEPTSPVTERLGEDSAVLGWAVGGEASEGELRVTRVALAGDTIYDRRLRYAPVPIPSSVRDSLLPNATALAAAFGVTPDEVTQAMEAEMEVPAHRPPLRRAHGAQDGSLWIELATLSSDSAEWVVVEPDGELRGRTVLPVGTRLEHVQGSTVWAVQTDELDVPWLVRLRVEPR